MSNYQPKGGMCATCKNRLSDCSTLPFRAMPVIKRDDDAVIVRCIKFDRGES